MKPGVALALLLAGLGLAPAGAAEECPVHVEHTGGDTVGTRIALAVRERILDSPRFRIEPTEAASAFRIKLISVDEAATRAMEGASSALAVVYLGRLAREPSLGFYLGAHVLAFGSERVKEAADSIVAGLDKATASFSCP